MDFARFISLALCVLVLARPACAHDVPPSIAMLDIGRRAVDIDLQLPLADLGAALQLPLAASPADVLPRHGARMQSEVPRRAAFEEPAPSRPTRCTCSCRRRYTR